MSHYLLEAPKYILMPHYLLEAPKYILMPHYLPEVQKICVDLFEFNNFNDLVIVDYFPNF